jgi:2-haloacid dehalogenase
MSKVKAVIFDAYGTLFDVNSAAEKCKNQIGDKWEGFANYWRMTQLEYTWLRSLMKRHKDFWKVTEDSLDKSMKVFNISQNMKEELLSLYKKLSTFPEVNDTLKQLKNKNLKLAILSNGSHELLNELVNSNNLTEIFDDLFSIEEVKIYKPDNKVYEIPINRYKIKPEEIVFLSSNTWDVSGGGNYGYQSVWVNRNNNIFDNLDYKPKHEIKNLKQLLDII